MLAVPVMRDVEPRGDPHAIEASDIIQKAHEPGSAARPPSQTCFLRCPLTMWMSDTWSTRIGFAPAGSTGISTRRSRKERTSTPAA